MKISSELNWIVNKKNLQSSNLSRFINKINSHYQEKIGLTEITELHRWSVNYPDQFWREILIDSNIDFTGNPETVVELKDGDPVFKVKWFPNLKTNFAKNLLRSLFNSNSINSNLKDKLAIASYNETGCYKKLSFNALKEQSQAFADWLIKNNFQSGQRIACIAPNIPETVIAMLGATAIGGIWASASPELGSITLVERFKQIDPTVLIISDGYIFKGEKIEIREKINQLISEIPSIKQVVLINYIMKAPELTTAGDYILCDLDTILSNINNNKDRDNSDHFYELPFDHPVYILFSSGTTGTPKCIVHGAGRVLIEHYKELALHTDIKAEDVVFYQTTASWMMWNWLVSSLMLGSTVVLYDGSPLYNDNAILWEIAEKERVTVFGTNARYLALLEKNDFSTTGKFKLKKLRTILSTGSPLAPESFDYIQSKIKSGIQISSISGGTDIVGCFALGCPNLPVYRGELQSKSLGIDIDVFNEESKSVVGIQGELVCKNIFPTMPLYFWGDVGDEKYRKAYWSAGYQPANISTLAISSIASKVAGAPGTSSSSVASAKQETKYWHHGDFVTQTLRGTMIFHGRSDTTLNPGGVRIGTAEIYSILQGSDFPEIEDSVAVAQNWDGDQRILLFVQLKDQIKLTDDLTQRIKTALFNKGSRYHVPKLIIQVNDIPKTHNNKISEQAVTDVVNGREVKNKEALKNPECLEEHRHPCLLITPPLLK